MESVISFKFSLWEFICPLIQALYKKLETLKVCLPICLYAWNNLRPPAWVTKQKSTMVSLYFWREFLFTKDKEFDIFPKKLSITETLSLHVQYISS